MSPDTEAALRDRIATLEIERDYWRDEAIGSGDAAKQAIIRAVLHLSQNEAWLLWRLYVLNGKVLSPALIQQEMPGRRDADRFKIAEVYVCKIRAKLGRSAIDTVWGTGYRIGADGKHLVQQALSNDPSQAHTGPSPK